MQTLTIAAVSSLPNVIRLATITKVQVFNRAADTSFNGNVRRFRSTCPRSEMFIKKCWYRGFNDKGINVCFLQPSATLRRVRVRILSIAVLRGREKAFSSWNTRFIFEITSLSRERPCADSEVPVLSVTTSCACWSDNF